jgi:hypothetical protein
MTSPNVTDCKYGSECRLQKCWFKHPEGRILVTPRRLQVAPVNCRFGADCHRANCVFTHPKKAGDPGTYPTYEPTDHPKKSSTQQTPDVSLWWENLHGKELTDLQANLHSCGHTGDASGSPYLPTGLLDERSEDGREASLTWSSTSH